MHVLHIADFSFFPYPGLCSSHECGGHARLHEEPVHCLIQDPLPGHHTQGHQAQQLPLQRISQEVNRKNHSGLLLFILDHYSKSGQNCIYNKLICSMELFIQNDITNDWFQNLSRKNVPYNASLKDHNLHGITITGCWHVVFEMGACSVRWLDIWIYLMQRNFCSQRVFPYNASFQSLN